MGIFGQSASSVSFDADIIDKATNETNTNENWSLILDVCDKVNTNPRSAKDCLKHILKRMGHADPHIVMQALTLLDACASNCGKQFHLEIASREFENIFRTLLKAAQPKVSLKMRQIIKNWAENDFKNDPELNLIPSLYQKLRQEGYEFANLSDKPPKSAAKIAALKDPNVVSSQQEEEDIAKAIELSLKESKNSPKNSQQSTALTSSTGGGSGGASAYPSLYPSFSGAIASSTGNSNAATGGGNSSSAPTQPEPRKVRALYDFEAAEENELTFFAGEFIHVTDDSDPNWWKGYNQRGDGLFPSNFVTADLSVDPESLDINQQNKSKKSVQFEEDAKELQQKTEAAAAAAANQTIEIDESKVDRLLHLLHDANPEDPSQDTEEMLRLEQEVHQMGPLIDAELERVDRKHAQLTQLSVDLVDAINLYHSLMRDDHRAAAAAMMGSGVGPGGYMGAPQLGGGGMPINTTPGGYQGAPLQNPHILYGAAGYSGAGGFPSHTSMAQNYGTTNFGSNIGQLPTSNAAAAIHPNPQMPPQTAVSSTGPGIGYGSTQMQMGNAGPQQQMIPMQFQNGRGNSPQFNGAMPQSISSPMPSHMFGPTQQPGQQSTTPQQQQQQHNFPMLPHQQQQQQFQQQHQLQTATSNQTIPATDLQHQQHLASAQQLQALLPSAHQQQFLAAQQQQQQPPSTHAYMHGGPPPQQSYLPMTNGPSSYMSPSAMLPPPTTGVHPQHNAPGNNNNNHDFSVLQQQMAAMSMAAAAGINQPVTQNFLVQNEPKNNIPIYQQQR